MHIITGRNNERFFQKIAPGRQTIMWTGKFDFDIILYTERSEPTWKGGKPGIEFTVAKENGLELKRLPEIDRGRY